MRARLAVLLIVLLSYAPSLSGGWVWDDHPLIEHNEALSQPALLLSQDVFGAAGEPASDVYRPLAMGSHALVQALAPGPLSERLINILLHLINVLIVIALARRLGAGEPAALLAGAVFGLHPGSSEAVAWISGRHELLLSTLVLGAWLATLARRDRAAGLLLMLAPFAKEPGLLAPALAGLWLLGERRWSGWLLAGALLGPLLYLGLRSGLSLPLPAGAALTDPLGALGALGARGLALLLVPGAPDAVPLYQAAPRLGAGLVLLGAGLVVGARGRPVVAGLAAMGLLLAPSGPASAQTGLVGDRYFYALFAAVIVAGGVGLSRVLGERPLPRVLWPALLPLGLLTGLRAADWRDDLGLFSRSLARDPANPHAAFHVAHDLHVRQGRCAEALPLYLQAMGVEPRAGNNAQACRMALGDYAGAAAMGDALLAADPVGATPAMNSARAASAAGDPAAAERFAREAVRRAPESPAALVLLGNVLGRAGRLPEAAEAFRAALSLDPDDPGAQKGLAQVQRAVESGSGEE